MKDYLIKGGQVVFSDGIRVCNILVRDGKIADTDYKGKVDLPTIDAEGRYVTPGFVEIHTHGCGGYDFGDLTEEAFLHSAECYKSHGTTTVMPTTVSCSDEDLEKLFDLFRKVANMAVIHFAGLHLEGPYLSMDMKGAQNPRYIRTPEKDFIKKITDNADVVKMITAAPEIEGVELLAREATKAGIVLSIGHSAATAEQTKNAEEIGFSHVTHMYCGTTTNRKIGQTVYSGIVEAAYLSDSMYVELIGDGKHIAKETMQLALKIKGADKINLTSDSMRAAGTDLTESYLGAISPDNRVIIEDGVAKLPDRSSYAGSIATSDMILRKMVQDYELSLVDTVKMLSLTPARIVGLDKTKGSIEIGKDADIVILSKDLEIEKVFTAK